jgi:hypothetical protein
MNYLVLIADIIQSKQIEERNEFQSDLKNKLEQINNNSKGLLSPYTITLGDEFQAVYKKADYLLKDVFEVLSTAHPVQIRFAIGWGQIDTEINRNRSIGMDGQAFYNARNGLKNLKKINYSTIQFYGDLFTNIEFVNNSLELSLAIMSNWKKNTLLIFKGLRNNRTVKKIAPVLDITERGVYKIIETNRIRKFVKFFKSVERALINSVNK